MLADDLLDWVIRAISLFNTIILLWLGLTVSLNAERRRWGTYVASSGLLPSSWRAVSIGRDPRRWAISRAASASSRAAARSPESSVSGRPNATRKNVNDA